MASITLANGRGIVQIDDSDLDLVSGFTWQWCKRNKKEYAHGKTKHTKELKDRKSMVMHRLIISTVLGKDIPKGMVVDHINGDGLDNRRSNLRLCTTTENSSNRRKQQKVATSKFKGVTKGKGDSLWMARIYHKGKSHYLGLFSEELEAARAYDQAALEMKGAFASLNLPSLPLGTIKI